MNILKLTSKKQSRIRNAHYFRKNSSLCMRFNLPRKILLKIIFLTKIATTPRIHLSQLLSKLIKIIKKKPSIAKVLKYPQQTV